MHQVYERVVLWIHCYWSMDLLESLLDASMHNLLPIHLPCTSCKYFAFFLAPSVHVDARSRLIHRWQGRAITKSELMNWYRWMHIHTIIACQVCLQYKQNARSIEWPSMVWETTLATYLLAVYAGSCSLFLSLNRFSCFVWHWSCVD